MEGHSLIKGLPRSYLTCSDILWLVTILSSYVGSVCGVNMNPYANNNTEIVTVVEGGRVILPCTLDFLGDQSVIWVNPRKTLISLADRRMIDDHRISVERPYVKIWNLLIRDVRHNDSGTYECRVNTSPIQIRKVTLEVQVPPAILSQLSSDKIVLEEGHTAALVCHVIGIPPPNVTWYRRHYRTVGAVKERIGLGELLKIHNISRLCDDVYECYVDNGVPPAVSKAIRVIVDYPPEVILPNPKGIGQQLGKETILECQIFAHPQAMTRWTKNGNALYKNDKYEIDIFKNDAEHSVTLALRILNLTSLDYGHYECTGSNFLGEDSESMLLYEIKPPVTTKTTTTTPPTTTTQRLYSAVVNPKRTQLAETSYQLDPSKGQGHSADGGVNDEHRAENTEDAGVYPRQHGIQESHVISLNSELSRQGFSNSKGKESSWFQKQNVENKSTFASLLERKLLYVTLLWLLCQSSHC